MGVFSLTTRLLTSWYGFALVVAALGVAAGILVFIYVFPGKPKIGVIDVPFLLPHHRMLPKFYPLIPVPAKTSPSLSLRSSTGSSGAA